MDNNIYMKKAIIISGLIILIITLLVSGCGKDTTNSTGATTTATKPSTVNQDVVPKRVGCGDRICAEDEKCDEITHSTVCPEDCGIQCGASVTISGPTCEGSCSVSGSTVTVTGSSRVMFTLENSGERAAESVSSSFKCDYPDGSGLYFKTDLGDKNGYKWHDYFSNGNEEDSVNSAITGNNKLIYTLNLAGSTEKAREVVCRTSFSSNSFSTAKTVNYNLNFK